MRIDAALENNSQNVETSPEWNRRGFLKLAASGLGALALAPEILQASVRRERYLAFYNPNTGETIRQVYWTPREGYIRESLKEISWGLRDHHNDQVRAFDVNVLDQLYALQLQLGTYSPVHVISGYRSPTTNSMLCERSRGVARNSYHITGHGARCPASGRAGVGCLPGRPGIGRRRGWLLSPRQLCPH